MDDDRIDFSSLDPSRDALKWERLVRGVAARALAARPPTVLDGVSRWARPALAMAAGLALLAWLPALSARPSPTPARTPAGRDAVASMADWAVRGDPTAAALFDSLEATDGQR